MIGRFQSSMPYRYSQHLKAMPQPPSDFRKTVTSYIESCHLEDGGYFFARIPPSSGMDTYLAISSLSILGVGPKRTEAIMDFVITRVREAILNGITGAFIAVMLLDKLGMMTNDIKNYARREVMAAQNRSGSFGTIENIYIEVSSELEETYRAVLVLKTIGATFGEGSVARFVSGLQNRDGGYGRNGRSTLASTFYATGVCRLLGVDPGSLANTRAYLRGREKSWQFIEELYWLVKALANLGEKTNPRDAATSFVLDCQRQGGGFSRSPVIGIPTIEYTFYALSILRETGVL